MPARWETFAAFLARHGLSHAYEEGQSAAAFDAALAAASFPPPVHTLMGADPEELYALKRGPPRDETGALPAAVAAAGPANGSGLRRVRRWVTAGLRRARQVARP